LLTDVLRILGHVQRWNPARPAGYVLENVAMQYNFRHPHIRYPVYEQLLTVLGTPVAFDAARAGSYAHRLRNYWTNLADTTVMQHILDRLECPHRYVIDELLGDRRYSLDVAKAEKTVSGYEVNTEGQKRVTFPTLMSYPSSRAFRPGKSGCIYDAQTGRFDEPSAEEREVIMGFEPSSTAAPELSEQDRRALLGQAIDLNALLALWYTAKHLSTGHVQTQEDHRHLGPTSRHLLNHTVTYTFQSYQQQLTHQLTSGRTQKRSRS
jgi:hypothetical protein